ncbi:MAG: DUF4143 domain-containing protein, partial [Spirochaetales bacterium]|nr:DUF4143 domain-containing protein [Spirochaetales bacterium]
GALLETWFAQNIAALIEAHMLGGRLSYWNEQGRHEVDFVIEADRKVIAIEVKAATRWNDGDLSGLRAFLKRTPDCAAAILAHNGTRSVELGGKLWAIPLGRLVD